MPAAYNSSSYLQNRSKEIFDINGQFGRSEVIQMISVELRSADSTGIGIISGVNPPYTNLGLYVPMLGNRPCIAVTDAGTCAPSLITIVLVFAEVLTLKVEGPVDIADIILPADGMQADEMSLKLAAEPITRFRLHQPMTPFLTLYTP